MGRPTKYSPKIAREICRRLPFEKLTEILGKDLHGGPDDMPTEEQERLPCVATFYNWLQTFPELGALYRMAMETRTHFMADEIVAIADDDRKDYLEEGIDEESGQLILKPNPEQIARARLRIDTRKFLMAKLAPTKYGDGFKGSNPFLNMTDEEIDAYLENAERVRREHTLGEGGASEPGKETQPQRPARRSQKDRPPAPPKPRKPRSG